jgi:hypothetical protein
MDQLRSGAGVINALVRNDVGGLNITVSRFRAPKEAGAFCFS